MKRKNMDSIQLHHFPFRPAQVLSQIADDTVEERGRKFMRLLRDLIAGEPTDDPISGPMIEEATIYYLAKKMAGQKGGRITQSRMTFAKPKTKCLNRDVRGRSRPKRNRLK